MVMRALGEVGFASGSAGTSESACAGAGALSYSTIVMLSAEAESVDKRLSIRCVDACSLCEVCVSCRIVDSDTVCLVVWQDSSSNAQAIINGRKDLQIIITVRIRR